MEIDLIDLRGDKISTDRSHGNGAGQAHKNSGSKGVLKNIIQKQNIYSNLLTIKLGMIQYKYQVNLAIL